eukprot:TRINITY_DN40805_c0_g1_i1.p1 TRINITY_DN40805_c0_g1~~TRINITY_DN40805_c0_g1_i1.p1  ORF type:complete len:174 (-),score=32.02 TRINITY_DN40805_c0_g1_i1:21-542(-)
MVEGLGTPAFMYVASVLTLIRVAGFLSAVDASKHVEIFGAPIGTDIQVFATCLALTGVPTMIMANFGLHWRVEHYVKRFFYYLAAATAFDAFLLLQIPKLSDICSALASPYVLSQGRIFVCGFILSTYGFWSIVYLTVECYIVNRVRLIAGKLKEGEYAELLRYQKKDAANLS